MIFGAARSRRVTLHLRSVRLMCISMDIVFVVSGALANGTAIDLRFAMR